MVKKKKRLIEKYIVEVIVTYIVFSKEIKVAVIYYSISKNQKTIYISNFKFRGACNTRPTPTVYTERL